MPEMTSRWGGPLKEQSPNALLDLVGYQRESSFRFDLYDGVDGRWLRELHPLPDATLSHDSTRTIPRSLRLALEYPESVVVDPVRDRVDVTMIVDGVEWPLGRYMWADSTTLMDSGGDSISSNLVDEIMVIDQGITDSFSAGKLVTQTLYGEPVERVIRRALGAVGFSGNAIVEPTNGVVTGSWSPGTSAATIINDVLSSGDYLSPWMDNRGRYRIRRTIVDGAIPDLDWDRANTVIADTISTTDSVLTAPNRYIVIGNAGSGQPIVGVYDIPDSAPHSYANRGYLVVSTREVQVIDKVTASAIARTTYSADDLYRVVTLDTAPDPRHDGHTVIRWDGAVWVETAWSLPLVEGTSMSHTIRRVYG